MNRHHALPLCSDCKNPNVRLDDLKQSGDQVGSRLEWPGLSLLVGSWAIHEWKMWISTLGSSPHQNNFKTRVFEKKSPGSSFRLKLGQWLVNPHLQSLKMPFGRVTTRSLGDLQLVVCFVSPLEVRLRHRNPVMVTAVAPWQLSISKRWESGVFTFPYNYLEDHPRTDVSG